MASSGVVSQAWEKMYQGSGRSMASASQRAIQRGVVDDPAGRGPRHRQASSASATHANHPVILVSAAAAEDPHLVDALRRLVHGISVEAMRRANYMVDRDEDKKSVAEAARWLAEQVGG